MDTFEFVAVLVSVVFGVALTNLLSGVVRAYFQRDLSDTRLGWSLAVGMVLVANWWGFFRWSDNPQWAFPQFLFLVFWSATHYLLAVSIYPYDFLDEYSEEMQKTFLLRAMLVVLLADLAENAVRGELFSPWYYPVFIALLFTLALAPLLWKKPAVMRFAGWAFFFSALAWMSVVRGVLAIDM